MALEGTDYLAVFRPSTQLNHGISVSDFKDDLDTTATVNVTDTPPGPSSIEGELYWDTDTARLYIYYDNLGSPRWVPATPIPDTDVLTDIDAGTY